MLQIFFEVYHTNYVIFRSPFHQSQLLTHPWKICFLFIGVEKLISENLLVCAKIKMIRNMIYDIANVGYNNGKGQEKRQNGGPGSLRQNYDNVNYFVMCIN